MVSKFFHINLSGSGSTYVVLVLGLVAGLSYLLTGGLMPNIEKNPQNPEIVEIEDPISPVANQNLQMQNLQAKITPTDSVAACLNNTVIDLVVDLSASMSNADKDIALQNALTAFGEQLQPETVIGIQSFGAQGATDILPFTQYGSNKAAVSDAISNLTPGPLGGTAMKSGFETALSQIQSAKNQYPDHQFVTILFSDGVPEVNGQSGNQCVAQSGTPGTSNYVCFSREQDPRASGLDTQMKQAVDTVYSVGIYDDTPGGREAQMVPALRELLQDVASKGSAPYFQETTIDNTSQLIPIFQSIIQGICE